MLIPCWPKKKSRNELLIIFIQWFSFFFVVASGCCCFVEYPFQTYGLNPMNNEMENIFLWRLSPFLAER